ncbi:MAG: MFS transporter [Dehalococcoidia bacterium]|nr:MFS transporter [Dehalococcoidia bacterium]
MNSWRIKLSDRLPFYYGWVIFSCAVTVAFSSRPIMAVATLSVFVVPMTQDFGWSRGLFSGAISLGGICAIFISPFAGRLIDKYGSGIVLGFASTIIGICSIGISFITQPWLFYALYVPGRAVFSGPLELGASTAVSNWFTYRRPFALALLGVFHSVGLAGLPILMQMIIIGWSWRIAWGSLGLYTLAIGVLPAFLLMARRPEDMGFTPESRNRGELPSKFSTSIPTDDQEQSFTVSQALHTRAFWMLSLFSFAVFVIQSGVSLHQVPHFIHQGLPGSVAVLTASTFAIFQTAGQIFGATMTRWVPLRVLLCLVGFTAALGSAGTGMSTSLEWGIISAAILGSAIGGLHLLLRLTYAEYYGRLHLGSIRGITIGSQLSGQVIGPIAAGSMYDFTGSYQLPFLLFAMSVLVSSVVVLFATPPMDKQTPPTERY